MGPMVYMNLAACLLNLAFFAYNKNTINLGCAMISGSFALAFYLVPIGVLNV